MNPQDLAELRNYVLTLAAAGVPLVSFLSAALTRLWIGRQLQREQAALRGAVDARLAAFTSELTLLREKTLHDFKVRAELYREAALPFADFFAALPVGQPPDLAGFERARLKAYSALALFAPQEVLTAFDELVDYLWAAAEGSQPYTWQRVRELGLKALNAARADLGIPGEIRYFGVR